LVDALLIPGMVQSYNSRLIGYLSGAPAMGNRINLPPR
jgi:hypothetical protein